MHRHNGDRKWLAALLAGLCFLPAGASAGDAMWSANPGSSDFNTASNWTPATVPTGIASFGVSAITSLTSSVFNTVGSFTLNAGAPAYTFALGNLTFTGSGVVNNSAIAPTFIAAPGIFFLNASSAGNARFTGDPTGSVNFYNNSSAGSATFGLGLSVGANFHDNSGAASATFNFSRRSGVTFADSSSAQNATINLASNDFEPIPATATFQDSSSAANATITLTGSSRLLFLGASSGGAARLIVGVNGIVDMSGLTVAGLSAGSIEGAGNIFLGGRQLLVGGNNLSTTFSGVLAEGGQSGGTFGALLKTGTGTLTLAGNNSYTGATVVNGGTLAVNGSIASSSSLTVNAAGTVGGTGTLPKTVINAGGALAPGNSVGTIAISGNLTFVGAGNYLVEVSGSTADRTNVSGNATLAGTLIAIGLGGPYLLNTRYTLLQATGGVSGTFALAAAGNLDAFVPHLEYDANDVYLVFGAGAISPLLVNPTPNHRAVAAAVDAAVAGGSQATPFAALLRLPAAQLNGALDQLSGEVHASMAGVLVDESLYVRSAILGRLRQASYGGDMGTMAALKLGGPQAALADGSALAYAKAPIVIKAPAKAPDASSDVVFWAQGFGAWGRFSGDGNAATVSRDLAGFLSGVDTRVGANGRAGVAAGYTSSHNNLDARGSANVETGHLAAYGDWGFGALNLRGGAAYAFHTIDTDRMIAFPGFFDRATAHYDGGTGQIFGESGYGFALGNVAVEPFAGAAWVRLQTDSAAERAMPAGLNFAGTTFEVGYSTLGARAASLMPLDNGMMLIPRGSLAWQHAFSSLTPDAVLAFQAAPGALFTIAGVPIARDAALAEAGLDLALNSHATIGISYVGQIASNVHDHAAKGKFNWTF